MNQPLIVWNAPEHIHTQKTKEWYWVVAIITLALTIVAIIFSQFITAILIILSVSVLVIIASRPARVLRHEINDRGILIDTHLYPFVSIDSFWIAHDQFPAKILLKSSKIIMPLIVLHIDEVDPEDVRSILVKYIAETEHSEPLLKHLLERWGF